MLPTESFYATDWTTKSVTLMILANIYKHLTGSEVEAKSSDITKKISINFLILS